LPIVQHSQAGDISRTISPQKQKTPASIKPTGVKSS